MSNLNNPWDSRYVNVIGDTMTGGLIITPSPAWTVQYEADVLPTAATPVWTKSGGFGADTEEISPAGILHTINSAGGIVSYFIADNSFNVATGWTVEAKLKIVSGYTYSVGSDATGITVRAIDDASSIYLDIYTDTADLNGTTYAIDTTDDYHVYRITRLGTALKLYIDGVLVVETTDVVSGTATGNIWYEPSYFASAGPVEVLTDYVYYRNDGVFSPYLQEWRDSSDNVLAFINSTDSTTGFGVNQADGTNVLNVDTTNARVGIGVVDPDTKLEIFNAGNQLKLSFDGTDNTVFAVDTNGDLTITPSGDGIGIGLTPTANMAGLAIEAGLLTLKETTTPTADTNYAKLYSKSDNNLYLQDGAGVEKTVLDSEDTMAIPINISMFDAVPSRGLQSNWNGGLIKLDNAVAVDSGTPLVMTTKGSGKILIVVNAGGDLVGDITLTGTSVDRNTGTQTASDTSVITLNGVTTDNSSTDANSNIVPVFIKAYITDKWFTGVVTVTTTDTAVTDMDVYHVSFEQINDSPNLVLNTFDANIFTTNVSAEFDTYLYVLDVTGDECDVTMEAELHVGAVGGAKAQTALANKYFRIRKGNIARALDGTTDGLWADIHYSNSPVYVEDVSLKIWLTRTVSMTIV